jgi:hypothetical protein
MTPTKSPHVDFGRVFDLSTFKRELVLDGDGEIHHPGC